MIKKYYCYIDETGQDTKGDFFLVSLLISEKTDLSELRDIVLKIEEKSKGRSKWTKTNNFQKSKYIKSILSVKLLNNSVFYSVYKNTTAYTPLVAMSVGKTVINKTAKLKSGYKVNVIIDGLRKSDKEIIRKELKNLGIKYNKIKVNLKDEQEALLRLTDALAGFIRDYFEGKKYSKEILNKEKFNRFFREI